MELLRFPLRGGFSVQSIFTFVLAVVVTAILWATFTSAPTQAQGAQASWSGDSIMFDTRQYVKVDISSLQGNHGLPADATIYAYRDGDTVAAADRNAYIVYFTSGVDPPAATTATAVIYDLSPTGELSNAQNSRTITIAPQGDEGSYSSCTVEGVGWIICPISVFLADTMDEVFEIIEKFFLKVEPLVLGDASNDLYRAWNVVRNIANIAFVIAFLIIIYSQLTSIGVSNYGIKKLLPRLIITAVLVNLSFLISAVAVDISNVLGFAIHDTFTEMRTSMFNIDNSTFGGDINWGTLTAAVLGGTALGYFAIGSMGGMVYILVPLLVGLALTLVFVAIVLAARQALIIILVIISPLAFVAYLLPNTEKLYERWQGLFMTMLIFFPAFAFVFGGAQLAGQIIIQNAGNNFVMVILGMAVQVAPLVLTPLILKFSGNLLGKIAQIANNPQRGLQDRANNWAKDRQEMKRKQTLAADTSWKKPWTYGSKVMQRLDGNQKRVKGRTELYQMQADTKYHASKRYQKLHGKVAGAEEDKKRITNKNDAHIEALKTNRSSVLYRKASETEASKEMLEGARNATNERFNRERRIAGTALYQSSDILEDSKLRLEQSEGELSQFRDIQRTTKGSPIHQQFMKTERAKYGATTAKANTEMLVEEYKGGKIDRATLDVNEQAMMDSMFKTTRELSAIKQGTMAAQNTQQQEVARLLVEPDGDTDRLLTIAAGVDPNGRQRAITAALAQQKKARNEVLENAQSAIRLQNYSDTQIRLLAEGTAVPGIDLTHDVKAAALRITLGTKNNAEFVAALENIDFSFPGVTDEQRKELYIIAADTLLENSARAPFLTAGMIGKLKAGNDFLNNPFTGAYGRDGLNALIQNAVSNQKLDSGKFQGAGLDYSTAINNAIEAAPGGTLPTDSRHRILEELARTLDPDREASEGLGDSKPKLQQLQDILALEAIENREVDVNRLKTPGAHTYIQGLYMAMLRNPGRLSDPARRYLLDELTTAETLGPSILGGDSLQAIEALRHELS